MRKHPEPYILLAERALDRLESYVPETEDIFLQQPVVQDAILLQTLRIGENLSQLRTRFPNQYKHAPAAWDQIIGLRNTIPMATSTSSYRTFGGISSKISMSYGLRWLRRAAKDGSR